MIITSFQGLSISHRNVVIRHCIIRSKTGAVQSFCIGIRAEDDQTPIMILREEDRLVTKEYTVGL
ncbi:MAG TPA: hypothetical protein PLA74_02365 [Syntrophales bacterium]|nr:hypothetical protein [Syntrophales bacterium]HPQ43156.1 hypothetical protein [Syntrophales bacterium]